MRNRTHNKVWRRYEGKRMYNETEKRYYVSFYWSNLRWHYQVFDRETAKRIESFGTDSKRAYEEAERLNRTQ